jgi:Alpha-glucosidases, family 31 of glycosyl hydrolases
MYRPLDSVPVLAKAGSIIPLSNNGGNDVSNPSSFDLYVYSGTGSFALYEDDGISQDYLKGVCLKTQMSVETEGDKLTFKIAPAEGDLSLAPETREYNVFFKDITSFGKAAVDGKNVKAAGKITLKVKAVEGAEVILEDIILIS